MPAMPLFLHGEEDEMTPDERPVRLVCLECAYIYDPAKGDPSQNIPPGVPFERLPKTWKCPECCISIQKRGVFKKLDD